MVPGAAFFQRHHHVRAPYNTLVPPTVVEQAITFVTMTSSASGAQRRARSAGAQLLELASAAISPASLGLGELGGGVGRRDDPAGEVDAQLAAPA